MTTAAEDGLKAAHDVIASRRDFQLDARDVALLILLHADMEQGVAQGFVCDVEQLRALSSKVDVFLGLSIPAAEKRLTESINRLLRADCLARADMTRLKRSELAQYRLTSLGLALAEWQIHQVRFDGEPLGAILAAFNVQLTAIYDQTRHCTNDDQWRLAVSHPMRYVARELLDSVTRHQRLLDRSHEDLRGFVPSLLKESSEEAIERCRSVLDAVMTTIRDLLRATIDISNAGFALLDRIQDAADAQGRPDVATACEDVRRRLDTIVDWTTQRHLDWGGHYDTVHSYLRFVAMVDRSRKVTDALKRSIAEVPDWTLEVADAPPLLWLGERPAQQAKGVVRRLRQDQPQGAEEVGIDELPQRLQAISDELLSQGCARWSDVTAQALLQAPAVRVIARLPDIMQYLVHRGTVNDSNRISQSLDEGGLILEELEVRTK